MIKKNLSPDIKIYCTLWHSTVFYMRFYYRYAVIFQVIIDIYWSDSEILCRRLMYSLLEVSKKPQNLMKK